MLTAAQLQDRIRNSTETQITFKWKFLIVRLRDSKAKTKKEGKWGSKVEEEEKWRIRERIHLVGRNGSQK